MTLLVELTVVIWMFFCFFYVTVVYEIDIRNFPLLEQTEGSSETTEKLKKSISGFLGVISETLAPPPDKTIDCDVITLMATPTGTTEVYDSSKVTSLIVVDTNKTLVLSVILQVIEIIHENNK